MDLELKDLRDNLREKDITLEVERPLLDHLGKKGFDPVFGARPLRRVIQNEVEDRLSDALLEGQFSEGDAIRLDYVDGEVTAEKIASAPLPEPPAEEEQEPVLTPLSVPAFSQPMREGRREAALASSGTRCLAGVRMSGTTFRPEPQSRPAGPAPSPWGEAPQGAKTSSSKLFVVCAVSPGGGLVVVGAGPEAAVEVADEAVGERAQRLVVEVAGSTPPPVEVVAAGTDLQ